MLTAKRIIEFCPGCWKNKWIVDSISHSIDGIDVKRIPGMAQVYPQEISCTITTRINDRLIPRRNMIMVLALYPITPQALQEIG
jgi:hypothetical protein